MCRVKVRDLLPSTGDPQRGSSSNLLPWCFYMIINTPTLTAWLYFNNQGDSNWLSPFPECSLVWCDLSICVFPAERLDPHHRGERCAGSCRLRHLGRPEPHLIQGGWPLTFAQKKKLSVLFCEQWASGLTLSASLMHEEYLNAAPLCCCGGRSAVCSLLLRYLVVGTDDVRSFFQFKKALLSTFFICFRLQTNHGCKYGQTIESWHHVVSVCCVVKPRWHFEIFNTHVLTVCSHSVCEEKSLSKQKPEILKQPESQGVSLFYKSSIFLHICYS